MDIVFLVDFDGTITRQDTCVAMVDKFAHEDAKKLDELWASGKLTTQQCSEEAFKLMDVTEEDLRQFIQGLEADLSFGDFINYARKEGHQVYIVSDGYDFTIDLVLKKYGWDVKYFCNHLEFKDGQYVLGFPNTNENCNKCGTCKTDILTRFRPKHQIIYIGDGYSDRCPVRYADAVFAKNQLLAYCRQEGIPALEYESFSDILDNLKQISL